MNPLSLLRRKRDGEALDATEWRFLLDGLESEAWPRSQMAALLMATFFRGLDAAEIEAVAAWLRPAAGVPDLTKVKEARVGFRAVGGHADKLTLLLGPILAAAGYACPVTFSPSSLRRVAGLLESNPRVELAPSPKRLEELLATVGTAFFAEAGGERLRALQEETATADNAAWVVARVVAEGLCQGVVFGLQETVHNSRNSALAENLVALGRQAGLSVSALVVDWTLPTGRTTGAALAMNECVAFLRRGPQDSPPDDRLHGLVMEFAAEMACLGETLLGRKRPSAPAVRELLEEVLSSGKAYAKFLEIVSLTGGDTELLDEGLPLAPKVFPLLASSSGSIVTVSDTGPALEALGGTGVKSHPDVGFRWEKSVGESVRKGEAIAQIYAKDKRSADHALTILENALTIAPTAQPKPKLILRRI